VSESFHIMHLIEHMAPQMDREKTSVRGFSQHFPFFLFPV